MKQQSNENKIIDLQCRSMRDNMIFTGIDEPNMEQVETEDIEVTLHDLF